MNKKAQKEENKNTNEKGERKMQKNKKESIKYMKENKKGITLVALVVTIVVLLILAGVTITMLFGENGIIKTAQRAKEETELAQQQTEQGLQDLVDQMDTILNGSSGGNPPTVTKTIEEVISKLPSDTNQNVVDSYGNKITIPAGFTIVPNGTDNVVYSYDKVDGTSTGVPVVQDGIVIQNATDGNQFVWVPVGDIKNSDETTSTITLGRYSSFTKDSTTGLYTPAQTASVTDYDTPVPIVTYYVEVSDSFAGDGTTYNSASSYGNTKAYDLQEWISTTRANGGYYIARYEASKNETDNTKAASKSGQTVWASITQPNAAIAAKATYPAPTDEENKDDYNYYSDLINSYAWDTAIIFIQTYSENSTYASDNNSNSFTTTGTNGDQVCNINDMSGNAYEWTTETSTNSGSYGDFPCTKRGGYYDTNDGNASDYTSCRIGGATDYSDSDVSFRLTLYVK